MARLDRRHILTIALLGDLLWTGRDSKADEPKISFVSWVNTLYVGALARREAAEAGAGARFSDEELQALFSPEVQAMRDAVEDRTPPPTEPVGPILHILFGWGALPRRKIEIVSLDYQQPEASSQVSFASKFSWSGSSTSSKAL